MRIDHRTLEAQGIELEPGKKIGVGRDRRDDKTLPRYVKERITAQEKVAHENGEAILADPILALDSIAHQRATFTERDLAKWLHTRTSGAEQFQAALLKVKASDELVVLGKDDRNVLRYSTRSMLEAEKSLLNRSLAMAPRKGHGVAEKRQAAVLKESTLSAEQRTAFEHVTGQGDLKALVGVAGSGKSTMLAAARKAWEAEGLTVKGASLSKVASQPNHRDQRDSEQPPNPQMAVANNAGNQPDAAEDQWDAGQRGHERSDEAGRDDRRPKNIQQDSHGPQA